jgi:hypothetical protein
MPSTIDFSGWVERLRAFPATLSGRDGLAFESWAVDPPLAPQKKLELSAALGHAIPARFLEFLTATAGTECRYTFEYDPDNDAETNAYLGLFPDVTTIYGGPCIGPADDIVGWAIKCHEWGAQLAPQIGQDAAGHWQTALPFIDVGNGDYVSLWLGTRGEVGDDPPVIYLSHEDRSRWLAPSFSGFLFRWERLAYLGPEIWLLERFLTDGGISATSSSVTDFRCFLGLRVSPRF